jgi:hypothetical protein
MAHERQTEPFSGRTLGCSVVAKFLNLSQGGREDETEARIFGVRAAAYELQILLLLGRNIF